MGLSIRAVDESVPAPRATCLDLSCDGVHGLLPPACASFVAGGYIEQHRAAVKAGWRFQEGGRVLGPCCT